MGGRPPLGYDGGAPGAPRALEPGLADLLSHVLVGHIAKRLSPWPRGALIFAVGSALPDVVGRVPRIVMGMVDVRGRLAIPPMLYDLWNALHLPIPFLILCALIALAAPARFRRPLWRNLALGGLLHMAVDFTQHHIDPTIYKCLWPFSFQGWELGWVSTEASLAWLPWLAPAALLVEAWHRRRARGDVAREG